MTDATVQITLTPEQIAFYQQTIGRKFTQDDLTPELYGAAEAYAKAYEGDFAYMVEMRDKVRRFAGLSDGQAKGVLNCMAAEGKRTTKAARLTITVDQEIPEGKYDVETIDGTFRLKVRRYGHTTNVYIEDDRADYGWSRVASIRDGILTPGYAANDETNEAILCLASEHAQLFAVAYGKRTGRCGICGRELTDPASIAAGIGPICAQRFG